ncbi:hypothetical protein C8R43DRAFT_590257 [Mycena crocata]|nr:hypothetical protein C8R43DRAFT_590257 [Mycena crocata]
MFSLQLLCSLLPAALLVSASPTGTRKDGCCDPAKATMKLPANQTALVAPTTPPLYVMLGVGIQNYTCSSATSSYASIGAVASLFDISCLDKSPGFPGIQTTAMNIWNKASASTKAISIGSRVGAPNLLGAHYFVTAPSGTGISPKWDFTANPKFAHDPNAFVIAAKTGDVLAPTNPTTNVDWLMLNGVQGSLAKTIFRVDTVGGQPPTSCTAGSAPITVKYTAKYYLF